MNKRIEYKSENGYTGVLYGERSLSVFREDGKEVFHTGSRGFNTYAELVEAVETFPEFYDRLLSISHGDIEDEDNDI